MKTICKYLIIAITFFTLSTCKKYDEGGFYLFAKHNLLSHGGEWSLEKFEVNGIDSTDFVISNNDQNIKKNFMRIFYSKPRYYLVFQNLKSVGFSLNNKDELHFGKNNGSSIYTIDSNLVIRALFSPEGESADWKIIKLKSKEFILKNKSKNEYLLIFKSNK